MPIKLEKIENPQELEVWVDGPGGANRLFIYRGIAVFHFKGRGKDWHFDAWDNIVNFRVGRPFEAHQVRKVIGTAYLNSIKNDGHAMNAGWSIVGVYEVTPGMEGPPAEIQANVYLSVRDSDGYLLRIGYEVQVFAEM